MFSRAMFIPASINCPMSSGLLVAGPSVAIILVLRMVVRPEPRDVDGEFNPFHINFQLPGDASYSIIRLNGIGKDQSSRHGANHGEESRRPGARAFPALPLLSFRRD